MTEPLQLTAQPLRARLAESSLVTVIRSQALGSLLWHEAGANQPVEHGLADPLGGLYFSTQPSRLREAFYAKSCIRASEHLPLPEGERIGPRIAPDS
jgi:hypothetical protein